MFFCGIENLGRVERLEPLRDYLLTFHKGVYIEEKVSMLTILSQINLILETFHLDNESDIKKQYSELRTRILDWLRERNTKPEVDD